MTITAGRLADLVILSRDIFKIDRPNRQSAGRNDDHGWPRGLQVKITYPVTRRLLEFCVTSGPHHDNVVNT